MKQKSKKSELLKRDVIKLMNFAKNNSPAAQRQHLSATAFRFLLETQNPERVCRISKSCRKFIDNELGHFGRFDSRDAVTILTDCVMSHLVLDKSNETHKLIDGGIYRNEI